MESSCNGSTNGKVDSTQSMWHGSVNTSTDTLVPMVETKSQNGSANVTPMTANDLISTDSTDAGESLHKHSTDTTAASLANTQNQQQEKPTEQYVAEKSKIAIVSTNYNNILPKVHSSTPSSSISIRPNQLSTNGSNISPAASSLKSSNAIALAEATNNKIQNNLTNNSSNNDNKLSSKPLNATTTTAAENAAVSSSVMEESILILPEHQKLEISFSGKCEMIATNVTTSSGSHILPNQSLYSTTTTTTAASAAALETPTSLNAATIATSSAAANSAISSQRRRRTSSSNSKREAFGVAAKQINSRLVYINSYFRKFVYKLKIDGFKMGHDLFFYYRKS